MKENFPLEYLYVDVNGDTSYKRYSEKTDKCNVNPYTLASTPVIFAPHSTVQTIFELVKKNEQIKPILFYVDEFLKEAEKEPEAKDVKGKLRFYWYGVEFDKDYFEVAPVKMEVEGIDENGETFGIDFLGANDIKDLELTFDCEAPFYDEKGNLMEKRHAHPTLMHVVYGLFWELSFFGNPEDRKTKGAEILKVAAEAKSKLNRE